MVVSYYENGVVPGYKPYIYVLIGHIRCIEAKKREKKIRTMFHARHFDFQYPFYPIFYQNAVHETWFVFFFLVFLLLYILYYPLEDIYNVFILGQCFLKNQKI